MTKILLTLPIVSNKLVAVAEEMFLFLWETWPAQLLFVWKVEAISSRQIFKWQWWNSHGEYRGNNEMRSTKVKDLTSRDRVTRNNELALLSCINVMQIYHREQAGHHLTRPSVNSRPFLAGDSPREIRSNGRVTNWSAPDTSRILDCDVGGGCNFACAPSIRESGGAVANTHVTKTNMFGVEIGCAEGVAQRSPMREISVALGPPATFNVPCFEVQPSNPLLGT